LCHERQLLGDPQVAERDRSRIAAVAFNARRSASAMSDWTHYLQ
jgi:hypothetical protein